MINKSNVIRKIKNFINNYKYVITTQNLERNLYNDQLLITVGHYI